MAEISLAVVSLTFQVFSGCVQGYEFIIDAKHMPADCQYLRVRLQTEKHRLLDWAEVVRLDETDERLLISNFNKGLLYDVLDQQRRLLTQFGRLDDEYKHLSKPLLIDYEEANGALPGSSVHPAIEEGSTIQRADTDFKGRFPQQKALLKKSLAWMKKSAGQTRRLKWVGFDKMKMETLLGKLTGLNDFMCGMLNTAQLESLSINQLRTNFQIMQLNSSVQYLVQIIESTSVLQKQGRRKSRNVTDPLGSYMQAQGLIDNDDDAEVGRPDVQGLAALAQIKALNSALSEPDSLTDEVTSAIALQHTASETLNVELNRADMKIIDPDTDETSESQRVEAIYHPPKGRKTSVWIEWKTYEPPPFQPGGPDQKIHERVKALAALLKENNSTNQHNQFRAPHCLGYFQDTDPETHEDHCRFGLVFEKPDTAHASTRPISLHTLLTKPDLDMPSLTDRITLMRLLSETIERLHAVNWLHKGLRSANILFFSDSGPAEISYNDPYISGFDYSRPAMNDDMTEKPPENAASDIYRHPRVQGSGGREGPGGGFKKSYDLYSLGVILLEIAYWKPIDQIMGIPNLERAKPSVTFNVRRRLMDEQKEGFLKHVKSHLGNTVYAVVKACLEGPQAFGLPEGADEKKGEIGAELQTSFYEKVVKEFVNMRV